MNGTRKEPMLYEANIDSFNISHPDLLKLFFNKDEYKVIKVYPSTKEDRGEHYYRTHFGKSFYNKKKEGGRVCPYVEVYVVHSSCGAVFPVKLHNKSKNFSYTADFAGLTGYHEKSEQLRNVITDIWDNIQNYRINRLDIAIDFDGSIPKKAVTALLSSERVALTFKNTTYYKKPNEAKDKSSGYVDILSYDKKKKNNGKELSGYDKVQRLEFRFFSNYFRHKKVKVKDLDIALEKTENFILENAGIHIKTSKLNVKKEKAVNIDSIQTTANYLKLYLKMIELLIMIYRYQLKKKQNAYNSKTVISEQLIDSIRKTISSEVSNVVKKVQNNQLPMPKYASIKYVAAFFDVDPSFFQKRKKKNILKKGIHYVQPNNESTVRWDLKMLEEWMRGTENSTDSDDKLKALIQRSIK